MRKYLLLGITLLFSQQLLADGDGTLFNKLSNDQIAYFLGWTQPTSSNKGFCGGYFQEPKIVIDNPIPANISTSTTNIVVNKKVLYAMQGDTILEGEVTITQPGRQLIADKIILHRSPDTKKFVSADLYGHVQLFEFGKLVVGNKGFINFVNNVVTIDNAIYRLAIPKNTSNLANLNLWGRVGHMLRDESTMLTFLNSSYSTCQPDTEAWHISSSKLRLNKDIGIGKINDAIFYIKKIPLLYLPYFEFPIDKRRKTGFLYPILNLTNDSGIDLHFPFYLNLAPNYDAVITPRIITKRGVLFDGNFRYLTLSNNGQFDAQYIFNDQQFKKFKTSALVDYANDEALGRLEDSSANRGSFSWQNNFHINNHWTSNIDVHYTTDDYFLRDFGILPSVINKDQLLNQLMLNYANEYWQFLFRIQAFQTLHLVNQLSYDQYMRLPQLKLTGFFPNQKYGLTYGLNTEYVYFEHHKKDFYNADKRYPIGNRFNINPSIELPFNWNEIFFDPKFQIQGTFYGLNNVPATSGTIEVNDKNFTKVIPLISFDSGMTFKRNINKYIQTFEPRIFYLYVPNQDQEDIPIFDTNASVVSFDNLFRANRFNSVDRVGDANQFSLALISKILNSDTGEEKLRASVGEIVSLQKHKICLDSLGNNNCDSDPLAADILSPLFMQLKYYLYPDWSITGDVVWDTNFKQPNAINANFGYYNNNCIFNVNYSYLVNGDNYDNQIVDLNRLDISMAWPLQQHWQIMGGWNHYFGYNREQTYFYGIEYNSCCWGLRFVGSHIYKGFDVFENRFYLQFLLKGLGSVANSSPHGLLSRINGFKDNFS